jgi:hypothetical protein
MSDLNQVTKNKQEFSMYLGLSLDSCPYLKLAKMLCLSYYCLCLLFNKVGGKSKGWGEREGAGGRNDPNNVHTYE